MDDLMNQKCRVCTVRIGDLFDELRKSKQEAVGWPPGWYSTGLCVPCAVFYSGQPQSVLEQDLATAAARPVVVV